MHGLEVRRNQQLSRRLEGCRCTLRVSLFTTEPSLVQETPHVALKERGRRQLDLLAEPQASWDPAVRLAKGHVEARALERRHGPLQPSQARAYPPGERALGGCELRRRRLHVPSLGDDRPGGRRDFASQHAALHRNSHGVDTVRHIIPQCPEETND